MSSNAPNPRLVIIEGKEKGKVISLNSGKAVIGRSKGDVLIQDPRISRSHIELIFDPDTGKLTYNDLKSLNGTLVNGEPGVSGELHDGDKLQIGNTLFDCQLHSDTDSKVIEVPKKPRHKIVEEGDSSKEPLRMDLSTDRSEDVLTELKNEAGDDEPKARRAVLPFLRLSRKARNIFAGLVIFLLAYAVLHKGAGFRSADFEKEMAVVRAFESEGNLTEALKSAEALAQKFPQNSEVFMTLGKLYAYSKDLEKAITSYQKAQTLEPPQPVAHVRLIQLYLRSGLTKEAEDELKQLDQLIKGGTHSKELFVEAASLFLEFKELKQPSEKTIILAKALQSELAPGSTVGYKLEAQVHFQENRAQEAVSTIEKGLTLDPQDDWLLENLVFAKLSAKDLPGATASVENWLKLKANSTKALLVMAYLKLNDDNLPSAMAYTQKILQIATEKKSDPHYAEALDLMGQILSKQGRAEDATKFYQQACEAGFSQSCNRTTATAPPGAAAGQAPNVKPPSAAPVTKDAATPPPTE